MNSNVVPESRTSGESRIRAITVSREYGSGGGEFATRLARRLGWDLVDHAIIEHTARSLGTSVEEVEAHDEATGGFVAQLLEAMRGLDAGYIAMAGAPPQAFLSTEDYRRTADDIVRAAAARGRVVIVGRASQVILAGRRDVMHVRIVAPLAQRVEYVIGREGLNRDSAEARIHHKDHERASYLEREYHHRPDEAQLYDVVVNTSRLDLDSVVDLTCLTVDRIGGDHEPDAGLTHYHASPAELTPPAR
jgi:CMP/dCMP kinase